MSTRRSAISRLYNICNKPRICQKLVGVEALSHVIHYAVHLLNARVLYSKAKHFVEEEVVGHDVVLRYWSLTFMVFKNSVLC